jgi:hypothetical protein
MLLSRCEKKSTERRKSPTHPSDITSLFHPAAEVSERSDPTIDRLDLPHLRTQPEHISRGATSARALFRGSTYSTYAAHAVVPKGDLYRHIKLQASIGELDHLYGIIFRSREL